MESLIVNPLFISVPHAGEIIPEDVGWLHGLTEPVLMRDVDRYVDELYLPVLEALKIPHIIADCHRYVIDLNRIPSEFDAQSVQGAPLASGTHPKGLHWSITTLGETLIKEPMSMDLHQQLVEDYYDPFHLQVREMFHSLRTENQRTNIYHLDLHSMPSTGTGMHNDPGEKRADIVVSDFRGKSSRSEFVDLVIEAYQRSGFEVAHNWPYFGGGITQTYGRPEQGQHTVQVELNRNLYMDEETKQKLPGKFEDAQERLAQAIEFVANGLKERNL